MTKKMSFAEFTEKAHSIHENFYGYDCTTFNGTGKKTLVLWPTHGDFWQKAGNHMRGAGCNDCARLTPFADFVTRARALHGDKYEYDPNGYTGISKTVRVICSEHGYFSPSGLNHVNGSSCPKCAMEVRILALSLPCSVFIERARATHGDRYEYFQESYRAVGRKLVIRCRVHGHFEQRAASHLLGQGCRYCVAPNSLAEEVVAITLDNHGVLFHREWSHSDLRSSLNGCPRFDFMVRELKLVIEYDGPHHFKPVQYGGMTAVEAQR